MKKLFKALMVLTSFSVLTRTLGFFFRIFLSRLIGAEGLGVYQVAFSVFMVLETLISSGLPLIVSKETSKFEVLKDKKSENQLMLSALIIGILTSIFVMIVVFIFRSLFALLFTDVRCMFILFMLLPTLVFSSVYSVLRGNLWGHKRYFWVSFTEFIEQVIRIVLTVLFLAVFTFTIEKVFMATLSYVISCVISSIIVFVIYFKFNGRFSPSKKFYKKLLKSSIPITVVRVISSLIMPIISIVVPLKLVSLGYTSEQALSMFGVAMGMTFPLLYVPSTLMGSLSMTLIPDLSSAVFTQNTLEIKSKINFAIKFAFFVSFIFIPLYFSLGSPIGVFFYNNALSGYYLSYSSFLIVPICLSGVTTSCLNALNLEVKSFVNYVVGAVLLVLSILFLTNVLGILALVWGMFLCLMVASILNIIMLNKKLSSNFFNFKYLLLCILSSVPASLFSKWIFNIVSLKIPLFFSLAISSICGAVFYLIFGLIFNLYDLSFLKLKRKKQGI